MSQEKANFKINDRVRDTDNREGTISGVTIYEGSVWYDVRFDRGTVVRYPEELTAA